MFRLTPLGKNTASKVSGKGDHYTVMSLLYEHGNLDYNGIVAESGIKLDRVRVIVNDLTKKGFVQAVQSEG